jgi:hypothetical protein
MSEHDAPVMVFQGEYTETTFLRSLLESAGIETSCSTGLFDAMPRPKLYVRRQDAPAAVDLVAEFLKNGKRTGVDRAPGKVIDGGWEK